MLSVHSVSHLTHAAIASNHTYLEDRPKRSSPRAITGPADAAAAGHKHLDFRGVGVGDRARVLRLYLYSRSVLPGARPHHRHDAGAGGGEDRRHREPAHRGGHE